MYNCELGLFGWCEPHYLCSLRGLQLAGISTKTPTKTRSMVVKSQAGRFGVRVCPELARDTVALAVSMRKKIVRESTPGEKKKSIPR
jgi:hypothetical protein